MENKDIRNRNYRLYFLSVFTHIFLAHTMKLTEAEYSRLELSSQISEQLFTKAIELIDLKFGEQYALKNPGLLASVVHLQETVYTTIDLK